MPRLRTALLVTGAAAVAKRALRRRIERSPLWPLPALEEPISGRRPAGPAPALPVLVAERHEPAEGVVQLRLESAAGDELPLWEPGAHIDLVLPSGLVRQYSLCGDPAERSAYTVATRLLPDGRGGSREVHERLHEGVEVRIRGPRNRFPLVPAPAYLFIAGGIGITPVLPMLRTLNARGVDWRLLYGGRSRASMPYAAEAERLGGQDATGAPRVTTIAEDTSGLPDVAAFLSGAEGGTAVYCCGPAPLMDAVSAALPPGCTLHLERFTPPASPAPCDSAPFEVELRRSGHTVRIAPGQSVLSAVRERLPHVPYSCEQGFCGTCRQRVVETDGEIDHRDELLTDAERKDSMLLCVSRCRGSRLVLDL
ncbi:PDR/VanB family oxidoreductase [Streptomyces sp. PR69]|uniref:PDR/VanB family oxidoreductase n=1 Tax=Streptomyces sp. PR69 TaxID=2984950 RepID=UPI002263E1D6|nr:PDR/VanB family oxidoreductase [Streptomyces sp. PR69]